MVTFPKELQENFYLNMLIRIIYIYYVTISRITLYIFQYVILYVKYTV